MGGRLGRPWRRKDQDIGFALSFFIVLQTGLQVLGHLRGVEPHHPNGWLPHHGEATIARSGGPPPPQGDPRPVVATIVSAAEGAFTPSAFALPGAPKRGSEFPSAADAGDS